MHAIGNNCHGKREAFFHYGGATGIDKISGGRQNAKCKMKKKKKKRESRT
jgi:hypothetical protein